MNGFSSKSENSMGRLLLALLLGSLLLLGAPASPGGFRFGSGNLP